jgi:chromosomal replication initiation ATPase DnaA
MNPELIKLAIAAHFHLAPGDIEGGSRIQPIAWARQLAIYFTAQTNPAWSDCYVARHFGVNRSTVTYALRTVRDRMEVYAQDRELVTAITSRLDAARRSGTANEIPACRSAS